MFFSKFLLLFLLYLLSSFDAWGLALFWPVYSVFFYTVNGAFGVVAALRLGLFEREHDAQDDLDKWKPWNWRR